VSDRESVIPDRAFFKPSEVCEIAQVQAYVLRTWELEFPSLGVPRPGGGQRIYRRQDVERVLDIRQLVFVEGLTLAGARRRLEGETQTPVEDLGIETLVTPEVRERLMSVRSGLRALLTQLSPSREAAGTPSQAAGDASGAVAGGELFPRDDDRETAPPRLTVAKPGGARRPRPAGKGARQRKARHG
jgi:DNA-binding transcriptional MerR regulator